MTFTTHNSFDALQGPGPAAHRAYRAVLDAIVSGSTRAGELLTEGEVAEGLNMSRTPVREAFLRLANEGLLALYPKRGAVVTAADEREIWELLQVRAMFEASAVSWMAERGLPDGLAETLREHLRRQAEARDALDFARADRDLHEAIVAAGRNSIAQELYRQTGPRLLRHWHRAAASESSRRRLVAEHERLVELVLAPDPDGYAAALRAHLEAARDAS